MVDILDYLGFGGGSNYDYSDLTGNPFGNPGQTQTSQTGDGGGGSSIFDIFTSPFEGDNFSKIIGSVTAGAGSIQQIGELFGYDPFGLAQQQPLTGYQGGIPDYTATRLQVPNTYDPERRPGSGGQRYFTDVSFSGADLQSEADRLEALNKANIASRTRAGVQMPDVYAARQAAAEAAAKEAAAKEAAAGETTTPRQFTPFSSSGAPPPDNPNTPQNERQDFLDRVAAGETSDVLTGIPPGFNPNSVTPFTNLPRPGGVGAPPADDPRTPQNEYQDFLDKLASGEITGGGPFGPKPLVGNLQGSGVATSNNPAAAQSFNQLSPAEQAALLGGAMKGFARGGIAQFAAGRGVDVPDSSSSPMQKVANIRSNKPITTRTMPNGRKGIFQGNVFLGYADEGISGSDITGAIEEQVERLKEFGGAALKKIGLQEGGIAQLKNPQYLDGDTDGMADRIDASIEGEQPAALSDGEFVIPADVVSHLGNGNSEAGAKVLEKMMARVRKERTGSTKQGKEIVPEEFLPA